MFEIMFDKPWSVSDDDIELRPTFRGRIVLGNTIEKFRSSILNWTQSDYKKQWREACKRILKQNSSALITSYVTPEQSKYLIWWPIYKIDEKIMVQNHMFFFSQINEEFDIQKIYKYVPERACFSGDGSEISEWKISVKEIMEYLER
jgi:hypothetical protein